IASFTRRSWSADAPRLEPAAAARHESPEAIALVDAIQREADRLPVARDPERAPGAPDRPFVDEERFAFQRPFPPHGASMYRSAYIELRIGIPTVTRGDEARSLSRNRGAPRLCWGAPSDGVWGPCRGPPSLWSLSEYRGVPRLRRGATSGRGSRRATASPGRDEREGGRGAPRLRRGATSGRGSRRATASPGRDERSGRSEERRVGKECRSRWSPYH